jgi:hypothetical protein
MWTLMHAVERPEPFDRSRRDLDAKLSHGRGDLLRFAIAFVLRRARQIVRGLPLRLTANYNLVAGARD